MDGYIVSVSEVAQDPSSRSRPVTSKAAAVVVAAGSSTVKNGSNGVVLRCVLKRLMLVAGRNPGHVRCVLGHAGVSGPRQSAGHR